MYENTTTLDSDYGGGLRLSAADTANLRKAGKWGRFLGILSMIFMALMILFIFLFGGTFMALSGMATDVGGGSAMVVFFVIYGAIFGLMFYLSYLLYKFGADAVTAVDQGNVAASSSALAALARLFKIYGILAIVYIAFFAVGLIASLASGLGSFL